MSKFHEILQIPFSVIEIHEYLEARPFKFWCYSLM